MVDKINLVSKARLSVKGTRGAGLLDQVLDRAAEWGEGAIADVVGDGVGDVIGGTVGGVIGGEVGSAVGRVFSNALGSNNSYYSGPARVLARTKGLVFPNTPSITTGHSSNWEDYDLPHTNYGYWAYKNSRPDPISVNGKFTINTRNEADYFLGCVHFLRSVTKMHFGAFDEAKGTPPPVLEFYAMGNNMFNNVPVLVSKFNSQYDDTVDYVTSGLGNEFTFVPTVGYITLELLPYYNPSDMQNKFTLSEFKSGRLLGKGYI